MEKEEGNDCAIEQVEVACFRGGRGGCGSRRGGGGGARRGGALGGGTGEASGAECSREMRREMDARHAAGARCSGPRGASLAARPRRRGGGGLRGEFGGRARTQEQEDEA